MNHKLMLAALLFAVSALATAANNPRFAVCELLPVDSLVPWGYGANPMRADHWADTKKSVVDAPSDIRADFCMVSSEITGNQGVTFVTLERFGDDVSADAVGAWIKARVKEQEGEAMTVQIDEATCETGSYDRSTPGGEANIQHYVLCDRLVGTSHLIINMQQPEADKLPTPPQVKELLDQAAAHLTAQANGQDAGASARQARRSSHRVR